MKKHKLRTPRLILALSNHDLPTSIQEGDRRWWVYDSPAEKQEPAYYKRLHAEGLRQAGGFLAYLQRRDISNFNPSAPPPQTEAKSAIIALSRPVIVQELESIIDSDFGLGARDLVMVEQVQTALYSRVGKRPSPREVTEALKLLGALKLTQVRMPQGERRRYWAWRNQDRWSTASANDVRNYVIGPRELKVVI